MRFVRFAAVALTMVAVACGSAQAVTPRPSIAQPTARPGATIKGDSFIGHPDTHAPLRLSAVSTPAPTLGVPNETLSHGRFKNFAVYRPNGEVKQFVLFLSGHQGWTGTAAMLADAMSDEGAMVVGIDTPKLFAEFK